MKILLCDDDALLCAVVGDLLTKLGHESEVARDGEQAIERLKHGTYDVAILDFLMPKKNGLQVMAEVKNWATRPKIIMLSAISPKTLPDLKNGGPDALLEKPVSEKMLRKALTLLAGGA